MRYDYEHYTKYEKERANEELCHQSLTASLDSFGHFALHTLFEED